MENPNLITSPFSLQYTNQGKPSIFPLTAKGREKLHSNEKNAK